MWHAVLDDALLTTTELRERAAQAAAHELGLVALPTSVVAIANAQPDLEVVSWAGYPSGKQHPLVKGAEARLAIQSGAAGVAAILDPSSVLAPEDTALLGELIGLRASVPEPAGLYAVLDLDLLEPAQLLAVLSWLERAPIDAVVLVHLGHYATATRWQAASLSISWEELVAKSAHPLCVVTDTKNAPAPIDAGAKAWITDLI